MEYNITGSARIVPARDFYGPAFALVPTRVQPNATGHFRRLRATSRFVVLTDDNGQEIELKPDDRVIVMNEGAS
ncbi:hypothetical protein AERO_08135 [Aeromicrobium fastidiosum]|uniref:hypothetical protein n=1 Tax=Aeromicrobium fastidiosum TaxID=52699 RepID=UPI0020236D42|nr:hypothetical protein [Aeromicrobium fastidiosum]MCL8251350.1 hypothetical protein [Aeromicrobium fastidiosum]